MDKNIKVNFYKVVQVTAAQDHLFDVLQRCAAMPDASDYCDVAGGVRVRIERVDVDNGFLCGELVRQQTDNLPAIAQGAAPLLPNNTPLGHRAAFRYLPEFQVIALEVNRSSVSVSKFNSFLRRRVHGHDGFFFDPCLTEDALRQLREGTPTKLKLRVALPNDLRMLEGGPDDIERNLDTLRGIVDGNTVTVEVGLNRERRRQGLSKDGILQILRWGEQKREHVKALSINTVEDVVPIDLFGQQIVECGIVDLDNNDVEASYSVRHAFLRERYNVRRDEIARIYGG